MAEASVPVRKAGRWYAVIEIVGFLVFIVAAISRHGVEILGWGLDGVVLAGTAAASAAFHIRISALDERLTFGLAASLLGLVQPVDAPVATVAVWAIGFTLGVAIYRRDPKEALRSGARSVAAAFSYLLLWQWLGDLGQDIVVQALVATAGYLLVSALFWTLPAWAAGQPLKIQFTHLLPRMLGIAFGLNVAVVLIAYALLVVWTGWAQLGEVNLTHLISLTVSTTFFSLVAYLAYSYEARRRLDGVISAALALPWPDDEDPLEQMRQFAQQALHASKIDIRKAPPHHLTEIGAEFQTQQGELYYLIADRGPVRSPLLNRDAQALGAIARIGQETMWQRRRVTMLQTEAGTDPLTGLLNYRGFETVLASAARQRSAGRGIAMVYFDLDGFKAVNDQHGHTVGNQLLQIVGHRLQEAVRPGDSVARMGGDEFVVLLSEVSGEDYARRVAHRLERIISAPIQLAGTVLLLSVSSGVSFSDDPDADLEAMVSRADARMYSGRGQKLVVGAPGEARDGQARHELIDIAALVRGNLLEVDYQPIVDLVGGKIEALEALVRPPEALRPHLSAEVLVHEARRLDLLDELTVQVMRKAFVGLGELRMIAPELVALHINLELDQLDQDQVCDELKRLWAANPEVQLVLEITENSLHRAADSGMSHLEELRSQGMKVALDDFGKGYSTMLAIVQVPFDILKLDKSLVDDITTSVKSRQVIDSLARLAKALEVYVVAEGVENPEQLVALRSLGIRYAQGFQLSHPVSVADLAGQLQAEGLRVPTH